MMNYGYLEIEEVLHILSTIREWKEKCTFPSFRILDTEKLSTPFILSAKSHVPSSPLESTEDKTFNYLYFVVKIRYCIR